MTKEGFLETDTAFFYPRCLTIYALEVFAGIWITAISRFSTAGKQVGQPETYFVTKFISMKLYC